MNFRHVILTVFVLCGAFSAAAQTLVIYDARDLFPKDAWNPPCKAVFTEDYYYSEEWLSLKDRIDTYLLYQTAKENPDWIPLADDEFRRKIEQGKNMTPEGLRKAICRHTVGMAVTRHSSVSTARWTSMMRTAVLCAPRTLQSRICANTILYFGKIF